MYVYKDRRIYIWEKMKMKNYNKKITNKRWLITINIFDNTIVLIYRSIENLQQYNIEP